MLHRLRPSLALAAVLLFVLPATALAGPFETTFPRAAALCARIAAGNPPASLAGAPVQSKAACDTLKSAVTSADNTFTAATAGVSAQMRTIIANTAAACAAAQAAGDRAACAAARRQARAALRPLLDQWRTAARARRQSLDQARRAFWTRIDALNGTVDPPPITDPPPPPPVDPIGIT